MHAYAPPYGGAAYLHTPPRPHRPQWPIHTHGEGNMTPKMEQEHADHDTLAMVGWSTIGGDRAELVCLTCRVLLEPLPLCGQPTKRYRPCRKPIRTYLGETMCRTHRS